jgi:hypothetical protein
MVRFHSPIARISLTSLQRRATSRAHARQRQLSIYRRIRKFFQYSGDEIAKKHNPALFVAVLWK